MTDPTAEPSRKEREQAEHRGQILDAAITLIADRGYHETTMQAIAERAEFSVGYLYKHFAGKEEMYAAAFHFHMKALDRILEDVASRRLSPLDELRATYEAVCGHFNHHRNFMRIYHQRIAGTVPEHARRKTEHFESMVAIFEKAREAGQIRGDLDPRILASVLQGASEELFHELAQRSHDRPFDTMTDTLFELIVDPARS